MIGVVKKYYLLSRELKKFLLAKLESVNEESIPSLVFHIKKRPFCQGKFQEDKHSKGFSH